MAAYHRIEISRYAAVSANAEVGNPKIGSGDIQHVPKKTWIGIHTKKNMDMHNKAQSDILKSTSVLWDANGRSELNG